MTGFAVLPFSTIVTRVVLLTIGAVIGLSITRSFPRIFKLWQKASAEPGKGVVFISKTVERYAKWMAAILALVISILSTSQAVFRLPPWVPYIISGSAIVFSIRSLWGL